MITHHHTPTAVYTTAPHQMGIPTGGKHCPASSTPTPPAASPPPATSSTPPPVRTTTPAPPATTHKAPPVIHTLSTPPPISHVGAVCPAGGCPLANTSGAPGAAAHATLGLAALALGVLITWASRRRA